LPGTHVDVTDTGTGEGVAPELGSAARSGRRAVAHRASGDTTFDSSGDCAGAHHGSHRKSGRQSSRAGERPSVCSVAKDGVRKGDRGLPYDGTHEATAHIEVGAGVFAERTGVLQVVRIEDGVGAVEGTELTGDLAAIRRLRPCVVDESLDPMAEGLAKTEGAGV